MIRRIPEDFRVEELTSSEFRAVLTPEWIPSHPFAAYTLDKISLATPDALGFIARDLGVPRTAVSSAGLKDRHAATAQTITVDSAAMRVRPPRFVEGQDWRLTRLGFVPRAADASVIAANRFTIVVRALDKRQSDEMLRRAALLLDSDGSLLFVNYFGDQRFGSARHGEGFVGRALIDGDFEKALRLAIGTPARKDSGQTRSLTRALATHWGHWETALASFGHMPERASIEALARGASFMEAFQALPKFTQEICVEAYQSHLWNAIARELADALANSTAQSAFEAEDIFGPLIFPRAAALTPAFREMAIPTPSPRSIMPECLSEIVAGILADEGVSLETLRIPGLARPYFGGGDRPFVSRARHWTISEPSVDEFTLGVRANMACTVCFELPRGAYATVLLRALGQ
ncbi:MAG: tRNA pseudouridine(13) synthase TruD [Planctomycetota bacterium]|jgi:tRNA pseudouridine13 synthase